MKKNYILLFTLIISVLSFGQTINEFDADQTGSDTAEFIELLWTPNTSLDGFIIVLYNGSDDASYDVVDLAGMSTDANGILAINFSPGGIQNGPDAIALYMDFASNFPNDTPLTQANLIDAVVYGTNDADDNALLIGLGETVQYNDDTSNSLNQNPDGSFSLAPPSAGTSNTLSVNQFETTEFSVFPNPTSNSFVTIKTKNNQPITVTAFDVLGKQVLNTVLIADPLDVSNLNAGVYILRLTQNEATTTKKLVIQ